MKLRATVFARTTDAQGYTWVSVRLEICWEDEYEVCGLRPQIYTEHEWDLMRILLTIGGRHADIEIIERATV